MEERQTPLEEPTFLARKIHSLMKSLYVSAPSPAHSTLPLPTSPFRGSLELQLPSAPDTHDLSASPPLEAGSTPIDDDSRLIAILSSPLIMNGDQGLPGISEGSRRMSVWSVLDSMASPRQRDMELNGSIQGKRLGEDGGDPGGGGRGGKWDVFSNGSSIMVYSPLLPTTASLVELAGSEDAVQEPQPLPEIVPMGSDERKETSENTNWMAKLWPFSGWGARSADDVVTSEAARAHKPSPDAPVLDNPQVLSLPQRQRVWVPSATQLSLQAMWWGYRL